MFYFFVSLTPTVLLVEIVNRKQGSNSQLKLKKVTVMPD